MTPEERERIEAGQRKIEEILERNRSAIEMADRKSAQYRRTLATSGPEIRSALSALRRRGYLR